MILDDNDLWLQRRILQGKTVLVEKKCYGKFEEFGVSWDQIIDDENSFKFDD